MRDDSSTHDSPESAFDHVTSGFASLSGAVISSLSTTGTINGHGELIDRRKFLMAAAAGTSTLAGCPSTITRQFSAPPLVLPAAVQEQHEYTESTVEGITTDRSGSIAGVDFKATIKSHFAVYAPGQGGAGGPTPMVGSFASPNASLRGNSINPLATASLRAILAGDVVPEVRTKVLTRLSRIAGSEVSWLAGPNEIGSQAIRSATDQDISLTAELLGENVDVKMFGGRAQGEESTHAVLVLLARQVADNVGIVASVLNKPLEDSASDRPLVGADGHFSPDHVRIVLATYLELLPEFQLEGGDDTESPPNTPTPTPTPGTATSPASSGSGLVIDDFEDGDTKEYSTRGSVNSSFVSSPTKNGSTALEFTNMNASGPAHGIESTGGLPNYPHLGDRFRVWFRFGNTPNPDQFFKLEFGKDAKGNEHFIEATKLGQRPNSKNEWWVAVHGNGSPQANNVNVQLSKGAWYAFDISWGPDEIRLRVIDSTESVLGRTAVPSTGDNGDDYIAFKGFTESNNFQWDYAHILGGARDGYPRVIDDFEDGNRKEYSVLGIVNTSFVNSPTKHGSKALRFTNQYNYGIRSPTFSTQSGPRLPHYPHQGDQFRVWFRFEKTASQPNGFILGFGRDVKGGSHTVSASKKQSGTDWGVQLRGVSPGNYRANSFTASLSKKTWYAFDVSWGPKDIDLNLLDASGSSLGSATMSANGDNGTDFIKFKSYVSGNSYLWDYAHIAGHAR